MCTNRVLGKLLTSTERAAGEHEHLLVVFSFDHGVAPKPEMTQARKIGGGRADRKQFAQTVSDTLSKWWGAVKFP